ncbi:MAG TPA: hypothetical protein VES39_06340, partial [Rhodospirillales bacterium]|nr:hypothetical protein [Rhodospirillales bacterium]
MASALNVALCALAAAAFWTFVGIAVGRRVLFDQTLVIPLAPALGWATFNAAALPVFLVAGFTGTSVAVVAAISAAVALASLVRSEPTAWCGEAPRPSPLAFVVAAALALIPAAAVMPKFREGGVWLADPIFDHAKIALVDSMVRLGLPPVNPVFGEVGGAAGVSYYYLWHFSAATAALATGASGWEADAAVTWFTAWSSLTLIMGLAVWLSRSTSAWIWALVLTPVGSLRPALGWLLGPDAVAALLRPETGLTGWLFQSSWSPQHVQSACCAVLALLLVAAFPRWKGLAIPATLALVLAAGLQSSLWVGGVVVPIAGAAAAIFVLRDADWSTCRRFAVGCAGAALCAIALSTPLLLEQYQAALLRAVGSPVTVAPQEVLGALFPDPIRRILDLPAFWTVFLVVVSPAVYPLGAFVLVRFVRSGEATAAPAQAVAALAALAATSLLTTWLMASKVADNNDLGWRAVLPG